MTDLSVLLLIICFLILDTKYTAPTMTITDQSGTIHVKISLPAYPMNANTTKFTTLSQNWDGIIDTYLHYNACAVETKKGKKDLVSIVTFLSSSE